MAREFCEVTVAMKMRDYAQVTKEAVDKLSERMEDRGRQNLAGSGFQHFTKTSYSNVRHIGSGNYEVGFFARPGFLYVYEYGGVSVGRPMLWFPAPGMPRIRAGSWGGKLFRPRGTNVLIGGRDRRVRYIGVRQITHSPRLGLSDIAEDEANRFADDMVSKANA